MQTLFQLRSGELSGTRQLKLTEGLRSFPLEILSLADSLEVLDLSNNDLTSLPDEMVELSKLKILFASYNQFDHLPSVLGRLPNLEMIGFRANKISHIPESSLPKKLRWLTLTDNLIEKLPNSLGERPRLQKLMLSGNKLRQLPQTLSQAHKLELIRISANRLTQCPEHLLDLPNLAWLAFAGNPFCEDGNTNSFNQVPNVNSKDYTLENVLGQGASGIIYKARWHELKQEYAKDIAVKVFKGDITSDGYPHDELYACLQTGSHPNIVSSLAQVNEDNHISLVMNLIPAHYKNLGLPPSLASCTRDTFKEGFALPLTTIIKIIKQMDKVFEHLHTNYVCHGDLYAHNTLFDENNGDIIFGDFGAASRYQILTLSQQEKIKQIEQRALSHFIEDLLSVCIEPDKSSPAYRKLQNRIKV